MPKTRKFSCPVCLREFSRCLTKPQKTVCCSVLCRNSLFRETMKGEGNPNFGKRWSKSLRVRASRRTKKSYKENPKLRWLAGSANRGKKFSKERIEHMVAMRGPRVAEVSVETRRKIGAGSAKKWKDPEYRRKHREKMESKGIWVPASEKSDYELYYKASNWVRKMLELPRTRKEASLLSKLGVFNAKSNPKGVVRDHMLSRRSGFSLGVFPELIRHPANCQVITHSQNVAKKKGRYTDADHLTIDELLERIATYKHEWFEQERCLELIERYKSGHRYNRRETK